MANGLITKSSPINFGGIKRMLPQMMYMMRQKHMIDLRDRKMRELLEERMKGYRGLETQRHESRMTEIKEREFLEFENELLMSEPLKRVAIRIQQAKDRDDTELVDQLMPAYEQQSTELAQGYANVTRGKAGVGDWKVLAQHALDQGVMARLAGTEATTYRQEQRLTREVKPSLTLTERDVTTREATERRKGGEGIDIESQTDVLDSEIKAMDTEIGKVLTAMGGKEGALDADIFQELNTNYNNLVKEREKLIKHRRRMVGLSGRLDETTPGRGVFDLDEGVGGGAPISAFSIYKQRLIENDVPEATAEQMARERYPQ